MTPTNTDARTLAADAYAMALLNDEPILGSPQSAFIAGYLAALASMTSG